jgi:hypothetical protein
MVYLSVFSVQYDFCTLFDLSATHENLFILLYDKQLDGFFFFFDKSK